MTPHQLEGAEILAQDAAERLIVALDLPTVDEARDIADALHPVVSIFKIGLYLQMARGIDGLIDGLIENGKKLFVDYKLSDIGESMRGGVERVAERGVDFLTIQGNGDVTDADMRAAVGGKKGGRPKLFCVTVLTSINEEDLRDIYPSGTTIADLVIRRAQRAHACGFDGVIASGHEVRALRGRFGQDLLIITPGVRTAGSSSDDQKRVITPGEAIRAGADYIVVGRPILRQADPAAAARSIIDEMAAAAT